MLRYVYLTFSIACYLLFLLAFAWLMAFVGNWPPLSASIDRGAETNVFQAIVVDGLLIVLFGLQHSLMARPAFKRWWTKYIPQAIERSTYLLASCLVLAVLILLWRPIPNVVWNVGDGNLRHGLWLVFIAGWLMVPVVTLLINHFDLFGLRQTWLYWRGRPYQSLAFRTPGAYAWVRHPLYVGWAIAFWATPTMTVGHLLFAAGMTVYMLIAVQFEERDLVAHFGNEYSQYRQQVGMFVPTIRRTRSVETTQTSPAAAAPNAASRR